MNGDTAPVFLVQYPVLWTLWRHHSALTRIGQDITQQRETENQLHKLSRAVEQSRNSVMITNSSGTIEYVNPRFTELTGYSAEEVLGQTPRILKSGETSDTGLSASSGNPSGVATNGEVYFTIVKRMASCIGRIH